MQNRILHVAVNLPLEGLFDYRCPDQGTPVIGARVRVPFMNRERIGMICDLSEHSTIASNKLKQAIEILDSTPLLSTIDFEFLKWSADYYHQSIGEVISNALPQYLRQGKPAPTIKPLYWQINQSTDATVLSNKPKQRELYDFLADKRWHESSLQLSFKGWKPLIKKLVNQNLVTSFSQAGTPSALPFILNEHQSDVYQSLSKSSGFDAFLLHGVTGSGKTEVYLHCIDDVLKHKQQILVIVPEIGLTPQLIRRFRKRFGSTTIYALHSGLGARDRCDAWLAAKDGIAQIIIGTRSSIFCPMPSLGLIIVDEEHDGSLKQQDRLRYSARDLAVARAKQLNIKVILGSATPSLESIHNTQNGKFKRLSLPQRAANAQTPTINLIDLRHAKTVDGLSEPLINAIEETIQAGQQVLLYLNRRGFAPVILCRDCGWHAQCQQCDVHLTLHLDDYRLHCHHCGLIQKLNKLCPECHSKSLFQAGQGTERIEQSIKSKFPSFTVIRIDRDATQKKGSLESFLETAYAGAPMVIIGTQMLAKGHHLPKLTLVGILNLDQALFGSDFRSTERLVQQFIQVSGRSGREDIPGKVLLQTHQPEHPLIQHLLRNELEESTELLLAERKLFDFPPFSHLALLRAESFEHDRVERFLTDSYRCRPNTYPITWRGPVAAPMEKRAGKFRMQLLLVSSHRSKLHACLNVWLPKIRRLKSTNKVRWSIDIDPQDML